MKTELESDGDGYYIEIPSTIVGLYSLKEGKVFEVITKENGNILFIHLSTMLED